MSVKFKQEADTSKIKDAFNEFDRRVAVHLMRDLEQYGLALYQAMDGRYFSNLGNHTMTYFTWGKIWDSERIEQARHLYQGANSEFYRTRVMGYLQEETITVIPIDPDPAPDPYQDIIDTCNKEITGRLVRSVRYHGAPPPSLDPDP